MSLFPKVEVQFDLKQPFHPDAHRLAGSLVLTVPEGLTVYDLLIQFQALLKDAPGNLPKALGKQRVKSPPNISPDTPTPISFDFAIKSIPYHQEAFMDQIGSWGKKVKEFHQTVEMIHHTYQLYVLIHVEDCFQAEVFEVTW